MLESQIKLLKYVSKSRTYGDIAKKIRTPRDKFDSVINYVFTPEFSQYVDITHNEIDWLNSNVIINLKGLELLESHHKDKVRTWLPIVISAFSLLVSIVAIIISIMK